MGIDIYMRWKGQNEEERKAQITGFDIYSGHVGYLREAYHGAPYATRLLVSEAFNDTPDRDGVPIPASTLRQRLPEVLKVVRNREIKIYKTKDEEEIKKAQKSFSDFVELAEKKEKETGEPVRILASY